MHFAIGNNHEEFIVNKISDIQDLPTKNIEMGSVALVIDTGDIYFYNGTEWQLFKGGGGSGEGGVKFQMVDTLPETGNEKFIYLVPKENPTEDSAYDKFIWVDGKWEMFSCECLVPDWNQNDETAADYIKNRTHYVESNKEDILIEPFLIKTLNTIGAVHVQNQSVIGKNPLLTIDDDYINKLYKGKKIIVVFDNGDRLDFYYKGLKTVGNINYYTFVKKEQLEDEGISFSLPYIGFCNADFTEGDPWHILGRAESSSSPDATKYQNTTLTNVYSVDETIKTIDSKYLAEGGNDGDVLTKTSDGMAWENKIPFRFGITEDGQYGYYKAGADTVTPFKTGGGGSAKIVDGMKLGYSTLIPEDLDTSEVIDMKQMFYNSGELKSIPQLDTSKVTNMNSMFLSCSKLTAISQLDTSNVTDMGSMFSFCPNLTVIPQLDTSKVTSMTSMFSGCSKLTAIPQLDTSNVVFMTSMFSGCSKLITIPQLDTSNVVNMNSAFSGCYKLTSIDLTKYSIQTTSYSSSFCSNCYSLKSIILRSMVGKCSLHANSFNNCYHLTGTVDATYNPNGDKDCFIYVPDDMVETLKTATNWSVYASQIKGLSELEEG